MGVSTIKDHLHSLLKTNIVILKTTTVSPIDVDKTFSSFLIDNVADAKM